MKLIRLFLIIAAIMTVIPVSARRTPGQKVGVEIPETIYNFGNIKADQPPVEHTFVINNTSENPVSILTATPSCGCTVADYDRKPILPGESGSIKVKFNLTGQRGELTKDIKVRVKSASGASEQIAFSLKGVVVPVR